MPAPRPFRPSRTGTSDTRCPLAIFYAGDASVAKKFNKDTNPATENIFNMGSVTRDESKEFGGFVISEVSILALFLQDTVPPSSTNHVFSKKSVEEDGTVSSGIFFRKPLNFPNFQRKAERCPLETHLKISKRSVCVYIKIIHFLSNEIFYSSHCDIS